MAEGFEHATGKFGEFIKKKYAMVSKGNFARESVGATTDNRGRTSSVMGCSEGTSINDIISEVSERVNFGDGDLFLRGDVGEKVHGSFGE